MRYRVLAFSLVIIGCAALGNAQQPLVLQIGGGRVTLHAQNVPLRTILEEWARTGGARVINGERVAGAPVTLDLDGVPEREAIDVVLRGVSGYMLAAREPGGAGASLFDRIMILPTSIAPRTPPPAPAPTFSNSNGVVRPFQPRPLPEDREPYDAGAPIEDDDPQLPRPVVMPRPATPGGTVVLPPAPVSEPDDAPFQTAPPASGVTPTNPFGVPPGSSLRPGVITPTPVAPVPPVRNGPQD